MIRRHANRAAVYGAPRQANLARGTVFLAMSMIPRVKRGSRTRWSIPRFLIPLIACIGVLTACAQLASVPATSGSPQASTTELIAVVRTDPAKKPLLARAMMSGTVLMIPDPHSPTLAALPFQRNESEFIPIFSDRKIFDQEAFGTGFAGKAVAIEGRRFAALLQGDETVILNPGHRPAIEFRASELKAAAER